MKIGILVPSTSKNREWKCIEESYLYKHTLKSLLLTYDKEHSYVFYIGIDRNDPIYDDEVSKKKLVRFCSIMKNVNIQFHYMENVPKGHLTVMWNQLFKIAHTDDCEYFFQCGDDIDFKTTGWVNDCIDTLKKSNGIGLTGPINNNPRILTQSFVSRKHMELFGYYFPPEIINWFCDDWINEVYKGLRHFYPLISHFCVNVGGAPRYDIGRSGESGGSGKDVKDVDVNQLRASCSVLVKRDLQSALANIAKIETQKMSLDFCEKDFYEFFDTIYEEIFSTNDGGMKSVDLFSLYYTLKQLNPEIVIESGVWNGISTKLIRKTLGGSVQIICIDPRPIPSHGFKDDNKNTKYLTGQNFIDFEHLDLSFCKNMDKVFAFFDCHQDAVKRLMQAKEKKIIHLFFNDNYPVNCGSHFTLQHIKNDFLKLNKHNYRREQIEKLIDIYKIFPNIFPGKIQTGEGFFACESFYDNENDKYPVFKKDRIFYRWNTYVKLN